MGKNSWWFKGGSLQEDVEHMNDIGVIHSNSTAQLIKKGYLWKHGSRVDADPGIVGRYLEGLCISNGGEMYPREIVTAAKPIKSKIHDLFPWTCRDCDESTARYVVRSLVCEMFDIVTGEPFIYEKGKLDPVRLFVSLSLNPVRDTDRPYKEITNVLSNPIDRSKLVRMGWKELGTYNKRYNIFAAYADVFTRRTKLKKVAV